MKAKSKYNVGDKVWTLVNGKEELIEIAAVQFREFKGTKNIPNKEGTGVTKEETIEIKEEYLLAHKTQQVRTPDQLFANERALHLETGDFTIPAQPERTVRAFRTDIEAYNNRKAEEAAKETELKKDINNPMTISKS